MEKIELNEAVFAVDQAGNGEALVFLHAGVADRRMWRPQTAVLSAGYQTIAYDRRGFGLTETADVPFSHVDDLRALLDALGIERAALIGCSQGGRVAIDFTLAHPRRAGKVVLIGTAVSGQPAPADLSPAVAALDAAIEAAEEAGDLERVNQLEARLWLDGATAEQGRVGDPLRALFLEMNRIALRAPQWSHEIAPPPAYERVRELALPVLVMWGELDLAHVQQRGRYLAQAIPDARSVVIPGAAHLPSLEQPDFVNAVLQAFLKRPA